MKVPYRYFLASVDPEGSRADRGFKRLNPALRAAHRQARWGGRVVKIVRVDACGNSTDIAYIIGEPLKKDQ